MLCGAGDEALGEELPGLTHGVEEGFYVALNDGGFFFVGFCENEGEGYLPFGEAG